MARETQKQIIERLEKEICDYKVLTDKLQSEICNMQDKAEDSLENSPTYQQLLKKVNLLEKKNENLEKKISKAEKVKVEKKHNERGAGRKTRFTEQELETMKLYRLQGKTIREIAEIYECSVGLVHSVISGMNQVKPLTHEELAESFKKVNTSVKVVSWTPLINDDCDAYADTSKPRIKVVLEDGNWLRVYISKDYNDITWY